MDCAAYRQLFPKYTDFPIELEDQTDEFDAWNEHASDCNECQEWAMGQYVERRGYRVSDFPCVHIADAVTFTCHMHPDPWDCPDYTIVYMKKSKLYGLPIRDGGSAFIPINYCPWCGVHLGSREPFSRRLPLAFLSDVEDDA